jgi:hypothetical protein
MIRSFLAKLMLLPFLFLALACSTQGAQDRFADEATRTPSEYTKTDAQGRVLSEDPDDWRTAPIYIGVVVVDPAYPNPVEEGFVHVRVTVREFNQVRGGLVLRAFDQLGRMMTLDSIQNARQPGSYLLTFSPALLGRRGLHRLFIFDTSGEIVSYGDLMVV